MKTGWWHFRAAAWIVSCGVVLFLAVDNYCMAAQAASSAEKDGKGMIWYENLSGFSNQPGEVFKLDTTLGYRFQKHFEMDAGFPVYFVRASSASSSEGFSSANGIGDAYLDLRFLVDQPAVYFSSTLRGTAPTGDESNGFSTGRATVDWTNYIRGSIGRVSPFGSAGIANTVSDTHFFAPPFSSLGLVGHFEGGADLGVWSHLGIGASGYAVVPSGEQKVYSKLIKRAAAGGTAGTQTGSGKARGPQRVFETQSVAVAGPDVVSDHGVSFWLDFYPSNVMNIEVGYSRSVRYALDTVFFTVSLNLGKLIRTGRADK